MARQRQAQGPRGAEKDDPPLPFRLFPLSASSSFSLNKRLCPSQAAELASTTGDDAAAQRLVDERKRRNYSDFWRPIPVKEPYRVVLAQARSPCPYEN